MVELAMNLVWLRKDLRLEDNLAIIGAQKLPEEVVVVYVIDESLLRISPARSQFLVESLIDLDESLRYKGSRLLLLSGNAETKISEICQSLEVKSLHFNLDYSSYSRRRDKTITDEVSKYCQVYKYHDQTILPPGNVFKPDGKPYTVYTPFKNKWLQTYAMLPKVSQIAEHDFLPVQQIQSELDLKELQVEYCLNTSPAQSGGASNAFTAANKFIEGANAPIHDYHINRDRIDLRGTSMLSAHLKFGTISARKLMSMALEAKTQTPSSTKGVDVWISELIWREFYQHILFHFPQVEKGSFQERYKSIAWQGSAQNIESWKSGQTGYPIIDACMRCLNTTGWMHNRGRMLVAMFLTKDLLIDWRVGEKYFMSKLIDGDLAANNGGWQWSAGTGTDAAPYFRIFNPTTQALKIDPQGEFVRKWVPELAKIPHAKIHTPLLLSPMELLGYGIELGKNYPDRIVDHTQQRLKALAMFKQAQT